MKTHACSSKWSFVILAAIMIAGLLTFAAPTANAQGPAIIPLDSVAFGRTYGEWSVGWQQWADSVPVAQHPLFDNGDCGQGQTGPVWFLGGKFCANNATNCGFQNVVRTCTVPAGKALYVAVFNAEDSTLEDPGNTQIAGLRSYSAWIMDQVSNLSLEVDGAAVPNLERYRVQSPAFGFTLPKDNLFKAIYPNRGFAPGSYFPAVDDGVYVMLAPLPPGEHVIRLGGSLPDFGFTLDITYQLHVGTP